MNNPAHAFANVGRNDPCPCGSGKKFKKCHMGKVETTLQTAAPQQAEINAALNQASQLLNSGQLEPARNLLNQILQHAPRQADALNLLGYIHMQQEQFVQAEELIAKAISINNKNGLYYLNYAITLRMQFKYEASMQASHKALKFATPDYVPQIHLNIANCLQEMKEAATSLEYYDKAIAQSSNLARAYFGRGVSYHELGDEEKMRQDFDKAIELDPRNPVSLQKIAGIYINQKAYEEALALLDKALALREDFEQADVMRAQAMLAMGKAEAVRTLYEQLINKYPNSPAMRLHHAFVMPIMYKSNEEIDHWREHIFSSMDAIINDPPKIEQLENHALQLPFYQGYHGRDNTEFMQKLAQLFSASCPQLAYTAPHCNLESSSKEKLKIGFLSESFDSTLLTQFYGELIENLAQRDDFEVVIFAHTGSASGRVARIQSAVDAYVKYPTHIQHAQALIAQQELDILIYLDIGMHMMSYLLGFARLAPVQVALHGHPITSGIPNMDYYFSVDGMEVPHAQEHYTEKLIRFEKNYSIFQKRPVPEGSKTRKELGLPDGDIRLYSCPAMLFRLHPDMDRIFKGILEQDEKAQIILFGTEETEKVTFLEARFETSMGDLAQRISFIPYAKGEDFYHCLRAFDAVLDPVHFSLGTTVFLALSAGVPFVTHQGEFMRERAATYHFGRLGISELAADTHEAYITTAIKLANDQSFHQQMQQTILDKQDILFEKHDTTELFAQTLKEIASEQQK